MTLQVAVRLGALTLTLATAACSSMQHQEPPLPPAAAGAGNADSRVDGETAKAGAASPQGDLRARRDGEGNANAGTAGSELPDARLVHFAYDSDALSAADSAILAGHAAYLREHPQAKVRLEGHADERGTQEYNMALGERRARAARFFLLANGGRSGQIDLVSYGKTRPVDDGDSEEAWARNRRVEVVYR